MSFKIWIVFGIVCLPIYIYAFKHIIFKNGIEYSLPKMLGYLAGACFSVLAWPLTLSASLFKLNKRKKP